MGEINPRLEGQLVVSCPQGCGAILRTRVVFYRTENIAEGDPRLPIECPDLPGELLLHWINCPNALVDQ